MSFTTWLHGLLNRAPVSSVPSRVLGPCETIYSAPPKIAAAFTNPPRCNAAGRRLIQSFEQCRLNAYQDSAGVWTIGWGHTGAYPADGGMWAGWPPGGGGVEAGDVLSQQRADDLFDRDLATAERQVAACAPWQRLTSNEFSALVSFQFNTGSMPKGCPTLMRALAVDGDKERVPAALKQWNHARDPVTKQLVVVDGLTRRREAEVALWQS